MHKLLNKLYKIPNVNEILITPKQFVEFSSNFTWRNEPVSFYNSSTNKFEFSQELVFDVLRRHFPTQQTVETFIDFNFLNSFFLQKYNKPLRLSVTYLPTFYSEYIQADLKVAPASINFSSGIISFNYPKILSIIGEKFFYFLFTNRDNCSGDDLSYLILFILLFLLDHELGHLFFSPSKEQLEIVYKDFISKHPEFKSLTFDHLHAISNYVEDMYIEDKFKSSVYPDDPSIHLIYDIGRYFMRG